MTTSLPGQFEHYTQVTWLGEGGFGAVYRAYDGSLERWVALKTPHQELLRDAGFVEQFKREARLAAQLDHPNIVRVYRIGEVQGAPYIDMELVEGKTLADLLVENGRYGAAEALALIEPVCQALHAAHDKGILHRDVKPQNILVRASDGRVLVSDFGLAKAQERSFQAALSSANVVVGTFRYMPPEQMDETLGAPGPASDVYSLGVVLYELLTGRPPFEQSSVGQLVHAHTSRAPEPPSNYNISLTPAVESVVLKALQKRPGARFPTALALRDALRAAVERGVVVPGVLPEPAAKAAAPTRSRWILWGALAGLLVAAVLAVALIPQWLAGPAAATPDATVQALAVENAVLNTRMALTSSGQVSVDATPAAAGAAALAGAVAGTLTAQAPTVTPTPDASATAEAYATLVQAGVDATRTALPPTATPAPDGAPPEDAIATAAALPAQVEDAVAATLTAQAPTATPRPSFTPTPDAAATATAVAQLVQAGVAATRAALPATATPAPDGAPTVDATATAAVLLAQVGDAVAATLTAQAPTATATPTVTPTPNVTATARAYVQLLQAAVDATRTALPATATPARSTAPTPNATATERALVRQVGDAVAATLTAQAPTATRTPTVTATPNATSTAAALATHQMQRVAATLTAQAPTATRTLTPTPTTNAAATATAYAALVRAAATTQRQQVVATLTARAPTPTPTFDAAATATAYATFIQAAATAQRQQVLATLTAQAARATPTPKAALGFSIEFSSSIQIQARNLTILFDDTRFDFVDVPAGEFTMGSPEGVGNSNEHPQHTVYLYAFYIGLTEVTNAQYTRFVEAGGYDNADYWSEAGWTWRSANSSAAPDYWDDTTWNQPDQPVVGVTWYEAEAFTRWLSAVSGVTVRLPTEAEWEKAACGTDGRVYPWGDAAPDATLANFNNNVGKTTAAGAYPAGASPYGALDMAGNVWEWTADWHDYYAASATQNPTGPIGGNFRVFRGGGWYAKESVRCASRNGVSPDYRNVSSGFRVVSPGL